MTTPDPALRLAAPYQGEAAARRRVAGKGPNSKFPEWIRPPAPAIPWQFSFHYLWIIVAVIAVLAPPAPARASQVRIPMTIDYLTLREALKRKLYTAPGGRAELWNGSSDCQYLYAENPEFSRAAAGGAASVQLETSNSLALGLAMGSQCLNAVQWSGIVQALGVPYIAPGVQLKFHFTDLNVFDSAHQKAE